MRTYSSSADGAQNENRGFSKPTVGEYDLKEFIDTIEGKTILHFGSGTSHVMNGTNNCVLSFTNNVEELSAFVGLAINDKTKNYQCHFADLYKYPAGLLPKTHIFLHPHGFDFVDEPCEEEILLDNILEKNESLTLVIWTGARGYKTYNEWMQSNYDFYVKNFKSLKIINNIKKKKR